MPGCIHQTRQLGSPLLGTGDGIGDFFLDEFGVALPHAVDLHAQGGFGDAELSSYIGIRSGILPKREELAKLFIGGQVVSDQKVASQSNLGDLKKVLCPGSREERFGIEAIDRFMGV